MGVYIKNMEMPKSCGYCPMLDDYGDYPVCNLTKEQRGYNFPVAVKRMDKCPLIPVPPHGRLIDADAFAAEMKKRQEEAGKWLREAKDHETAVRADAVLSFLCEVKLTLDAVPTVLEAEEDE